MTIDYAFFWGAITLIAALVVAMVISLFTYTPPPPEPCSHFKDYRIANVPARCAAYYGVTK